MLLKSPAIVLGSVKYGDSSIILKTYTRETGLKSFIAGGLQKKNGVLRPALIQPLSQLNLVFYEKGKGDLRRLKEASVGEAYSNLFYDPVKSSMAMFLAEVLGHVLQEEEANHELYDFLSASLLHLDELGSGIGNFHLSFLMFLTAYLGFRPERVQDGAKYFDLLNGVYTHIAPTHFHFLEPTVTKYWQELQNLKMENLDSLKLNKQMRESLLNALLEYYRLHINDFGKLKSLDIVKTLLS